MREALKVYPNITESINMDGKGFDIEKLRQDFDSDPEIWRIEFSENGVLVDAWEKEA